MILTIYDSLLLKAAMHDPDTPKVLLESDLYSYTLLYHLEQCLEKSCKTLYVTLRLIATMIMKQL